MPRNGRRPQPTAVKALQAVRSSRMNTDEPQPRDVEPEPPEWATESWLVIWSRTCTVLRGMRLLYAADREALVAFTTAVHEHDRLARVLVAAPPVVRDANGGPKANPLGPAVRQWSGEVSRWASHFGLTPAERGRISSSTTTENVETDDLAGTYYR